VIGGSLLLATLPRLVQPPLLLMSWRWLEARQQRKAALPGSVAPAGS
jgi:hypothetical protein